MTEQKAYLEPQDIEALIEAAAYLRDRAIIRMLFYTGVRVTELVSIEVPDIDFEHRWVTIQHLKERSRYKCPHCGVRLAKSDRFCGSCGKPIEGAVIEKMQEARHRRIRVDSDTLAMVKEYLDKRSDKKESRLFALTRNRILQIVYQAAEDAGLGGKILSASEDQKQEHRVSPHRLRDAFATHFIRRRDDPVARKALQQQLGHQDYNTTDRYVKMAGKEVAEVYDEVMGK